MAYQKNLPSKMKILMVDDDQKLCRLVADYLEPMGYEVEAAHDGTQGLQMIIDGDYHAVILDVMMPQMDGFEVLRRLRQESDIPVLMLTARGEETDRIVGLEMGADDYLPKTFSSRELLARLRAVTRRHILSERQAASAAVDAPELTKKGPGDVHDKGPHLMVRTRHPSQYWAGIRIPLPSPNWSMNCWLSHGPI
jgi:two-component system response regulator CpxR